MSNPRDRPVEKIIIHCSDTPNGRQITMGEINQWHLARGFKRNAYWRDKFNQNLPNVGYHFVIMLNGDVITGRHEGEVGAHVQGQNYASLGICLIGRDGYTKPQWVNLQKLVGSLKEKYPRATIHGHREFNAGKTCPGFDVQLWAKEMKPLDGHIIKGEG